MANKIYKLGKTAAEINGVLTDLVDLAQDENDNKFLKVVAEDGEVHLETEYIECGTNVGMIDNTSGAAQHGEIFNIYSGNYVNKATGKYSHAEGYKTEASGNSSHAENGETQAKGVYSHAEGDHTIAGSDYQHAQGKYNVEDENSVYAMIIGNGSNSVRSNGFTVDWDGNLQCGKTDASGNITAYGTINGIDITKIKPVSIKTTTNTEITINDGDEYRNTTSPYTSALTLTPVLNGNKFYAMIVAKISFDSMTAGDFITGTDIIVLNPEEDLSGYDVVHINLFYDGIKVCAMATGYSLGE